MTTLIGKGGVGKLKLPTLKDKILLDKSIDKIVPKAQANKVEVEVVKTHKKNGK